MKMRRSPHSIVDIQVGGVAKSAILCHKEQAGAFKDMKTKYPYAIGTNWSLDASAGSLLHMYLITGVATL